MKLSRADWQFTPDEERVERIEALRRAMSEHELQALVVCGRDDIRYRGRTFYVTDIWQLLADTFAIVPITGDIVFIGGQVWGMSQAHMTNWAGEMRISGHPGVELGRALDDLGYAKARVGIVGLSDASLAAHHLNQLKETAPGLEIVDATDIFEDVRQAPSPFELERLRETSGQFKSIFSELEKFIRPGITELELAGEAHKQSRLHGLRDPMVLVQATPFGPTSFGTDQPIGSDDVLCLWIESAGPNGYWLEYRKCYTFGAPSEEHRRYWEIQKNALLAGLEAMKPGALASEFVSAVQDSLQGEGYDLGYKDPADSHMMYSLHGIGSDAIQGVWVPGKDRVLAEGEVVNVHPPVRLEDDAAERFGWLGITDNVVVTANGGEPLTNGADFETGFVQL